MRTIPGVDDDESQPAEVGRKAVRPRRSSPSYRIRPPNTLADWSIVPHGDPARCSASWAIRINSGGDGNSTESACTRATQKRRRAADPDTVGEITRHNQLHSGFDPH